MARLIDKLLNHSFKPSRFSKGIASLAMAEVIAADNVANFYFKESSKSKWEMTDFPNIAPPFEKFFIEFRIPSQMNVDGKIIESPRHLRGMEGGCLFIVIDTKNTPDDFPTELKSNERIQAALDKSDIRWQISCLPFIAIGGVIWEPVCAYTFAVSSLGVGIYEVDGKYIFSTAVDMDMADYQAKRVGVEKNTYVNALRDLASTVLDPALLAISFMHCKNVSLRKENAPPKLAKAYQKKHGRPLISYHVLDIEPMKKVLRTEGESQKTGLKQALHICRGHFKDYSKGGGLFGKYKGLYWWDSTVRGSVSEGIVDKDYAVKSPKAQA